MPDLFLATRPPWPTSKNMKIHWFLQYATRVRNSRRKEQKKNNKTKTDSKRPRNTGKTAPARHQTSTTNHRKRLPKSSKQRLQTVSFSSSLLGRSRKRPGDAQKHPRGGPKTRQEGPKAGQGSPRGLPDPPRGDPKLLRMQQRELEESLLGPRGAPRGAQKASGSHFGRILALPGPGFGVFFRLKTRQTQTKTRNQRKRSGTQRRAGGVLPTWLPERLREAILGGTFGGLPREPDFPFCLNNV